MLEIAVEVFLTAIISPAMYLALGWIVQMFT
jgi:hypothetical protein